MKNIQKTTIYDAPEGYFDTLPDRILHRNSKLHRRVLFTRIAAAAVLVIGLALFIFNQTSNKEALLQAEIDQEVELFINSGYWDAEDILVISENPDDLLDRIIEEEWAGYNINEDQIEEDVWY